MANRATTNTIRGLFLLHPTTTTTLLRQKTTSAAAVASRHRDPTFEKLMLSYKHYQKVLPIADLILSSPSLSLPFPVLATLSQRLRLNRGAHHFVRSHPRVFSLSPSSPHPLLRLTPSALSICRSESSSAASVDLLLRLLSMSLSGSVPLRAVFRVWRELGLPDDFEDSVLRANPQLFSVRDNPKERNTHILELVGMERPQPDFTAAVEEWRGQEMGKEGLGELDLLELRYAFKQGFPPGMRLSQDYRSKLKKWQRLPYIGPYASLGGEAKRLGTRQLEKRAVGIVHELMSLTVEKMVEVEKVSQFRKCFGIDLNIRDLFLDHPGMFYLSTKGKGHTVFLREAYAKGRLLEANPIYDARRQLLDLVRMRRRGVVTDDGLVERKRVTVGEVEEDWEDEEEEEEEEDTEDEEEKLRKMRK